MRYLQRIVAGITPVVAPRPAQKPLQKTWDVSQRYELDNALAFMDSAEFRKLHEDARAGRLDLAAGYLDASMLSEWFDDSPEAFHELARHIAGRTCLEIGPCVASQMIGWSVAGARHVVEPLIGPIEAWQREHLGSSLYDGFVRHALPAEELIPELVGRVDGAILCRNMLDHTPKWPFVLANMSTYAAAGCRLLLWTDLDHHGEADAGHYDITASPIEFERLIEQLGFKVLRRYACRARREVNWGCFAVKLGT
jgi:hypothetical protein